jgi:hypothetical protein
VIQRASSGPRFRDGRSRPIPGRSHDFAAVVRLVVVPLRTTASRRRSSPCEVAHLEEAAALRETSTTCCHAVSARGLGPRSRRGTSSCEWCARRFSGPEHRRTTFATVPARFRAVPTSHVRKWARRASTPFRAIDPRPQDKTRRPCSRCRASPVSRRVEGEPSRFIVGSPSLPFPAGEPELHDPPLRVGRMQDG